MCSVEWRHCRWPWVAANYPKLSQFLHFALHFISSYQVIVETSNLVCRLNIASPSLQMTDRPWYRRGHVTWSSLNFKAPNNISGIPAAISNFTKRMTYHPLNGHGYGHMTVFKFCRLRDAARRAGLSATAILVRHISIVITFVYGT